MIREANFNDIDEIMRIGNELIAISEYADMPIDPHLCRRNLAMMIGSKKFFSVVDEVNGQLYGFMFGVIDSVFWSSVKYATDIVIFSKRNSGIKMIKQFDSWAKSNGAIKAIMAITSGVDKDRTAKLYLALDAKYVGGVFVKEYK